MNENDITLSSVLKHYNSNLNFNNKKLYVDSCLFGQTITKLTNENDIVLLSVPTSDELFSLFIGCILYKRIPLIIQRPSSKVKSEIFQKRMQDIKNNVNVGLCICEKNFLDTYTPYFNSITNLEKLPLSLDVDFPKQNTDEVAFMQLSSGTTGQSKICEITHKQLLGQCLEYGKIIDMNSKKTVVSWLPLYHDMGLVAAFLLPLIHDAKFYIIDPFEWIADPKKLFELIDKVKGTHIWMPNFAFRVMTNKVDTNENKHLNLSSVEKFISCSEPTFENDVLEFGKKFNELQLNSNSITNCYALAENVFAVSQAEKISTHLYKGQKYVSCGKIIPGVSVVIQKNGEDVTNKEHGNIMLKSIFAPKTNKISNFQGYYDTGDIGFMHQGELFVMGRAKDCFVSYGVNVYPEIIEHSLSEIEGIIPGRVVCFGVHSEKLGTSIPYICAESESPSNQISIRISSLIKQKFELTPIVKLLQKNTLIKTSSGKFSRIENKKLYTS